MFQGYYRRKRVIVTGHTGFKGGWMSLWLRELGATVYGLSLPAGESPNFYETLEPGTFEKEIYLDLRDTTAVRQAIYEIDPDLVFHLAAQSLVRRSYAEPVETIDTNVIGTMNLLEALRRLPRRVDAVIVTSDKCYANTGTWAGDGFSETDPLGGHDPYSMSKAACEILVEAWRRSFFVADSKLGNIATARAGNVLGGGDYAVDRLVPDCVRALQRGHPVLIRNPRSTRPWQHVFDCLSGYLWLGARLAQSPKNSPYASAYNFGPESRTPHTVEELLEKLLACWPGHWEEVAETRAPEARQLHLSIDKAKEELGWRPTWGFSDAVKQSAAWYRRRHEEGDRGLTEFSVAQLGDFCRTAREQAQPWACPAEIS